MKMKSFAYCAVCSLIAGVFDLALANPVIMISATDTNQDLSNSAAALPRNQGAQAEIHPDSRLIHNPATTFNIDFVADESADVAAITFFIDVDANVEFDLSDCVAELPATHMGACEQSGSQIRIVVFSMSNATVPTGRIGTIRAIGGATTLGVKNLSFSNADGEAIPADVL